MIQLYLIEKISKTENELALMEKKETGDLTEKHLRELLQERLTD